MLGSVGRREMTFSTYKVSNITLICFLMQMFLMFFINKLFAFQKKDSKTLENMKKHRDERRKVIRPTTGIQKKMKFW